MSDNFDDITKGFNDGDKHGEFEMPENLWEAIELFWPHLGRGGIPTKGVFLVEYVDEDGRDLYFGSNAEATDWDIKGLLHHAMNMIEDEARMNATYHVVNSIVNDEDEDDEDEQ